MFVKMFIKLEVYNSSIIYHDTTKMFYSLQRFSRRRRLLKKVANGGWNIEVRRQFLLYNDKLYLNDILIAGLYIHIFIVNVSDPRIEYARESNT